MLVFLKKITIINENKRFICELLFFENMTIINFFVRSNFFFLHDLMKFCKRIIVAMNTDQWASFDENLFAAVNIETNCCESMLMTCFASCLETWNVIWEMRFKFVFCLKLFKTIHFRDHAWSFHRQFFLIV